jgi:hypothetical protein
MAGSADWRFGSYSTNGCWEDLTEVSDVVIAVAGGRYAAVPGAKDPVEVGPAVANPLLAIPEAVLVNLEAEFESVAPAHHRNVIGDLVSVLHSIQDRSCEATKLRLLGNNSPGRVLSRVLLTPNAVGSSSSMLSP